MKSLCYLAGALLLLAACQSNTSTPATTATSSPHLAASIKITLNGIPYAQAATMVKAFQANDMSSDDKTDIWFSQDFVEDVYSILKYEGGDGVRVYMAKTAAGKNTVVVVSTKDGGLSTTHQGKHIHQDYFDHSTAVLTTAEVKNVDDYGTAKGTDLYANPWHCPTDNCDVIASSYITCDSAHFLAQNFKKERIKTTSVWYGINLIKKLKLELIAAQAKGTPADGIRIYFAKNEKDKQGFVVVTTKANGNDHYDYYECNDKLAKHFLDANDHGEECPVLCDGITTTW